MHFLSLLTVAALPAALAKTVTVCVQTGEVSYSSICKTSYASTSGWVPVNTISHTETETHTIHATVTTSEHKVTVTPTPQVINTTLTSTDYTTVTLPNVTDTFSITTTLTNTNTATTTITTTSTETDTQSTTTTITTTTTPAGFTPVADSIQAVERRKRSGLPSRDVSPLAGIPLLSNSSAPAFPAEINCFVQPYVHESRLISATTTLDATTTVWPDVIDVTATFTAGIPTITNTLTKTVTSTITVGPKFINATLTLSATATVTTTSVETLTDSTTTTTTLSFTSTSTANGACQTNNILTSFQSSGQTYYPNNAFNNGIDSVSTYVSVDAASNEDCCDICSKTDDCTTFVSLSDTLCLLLSYGDGSSQVCAQSENTDLVSATTEGSNGIAIGNGLCGTFSFDPSI